MAEGFGLRRPPVTEADLARRVESGPERSRETQDKYPCPAESVPEGGVRMQSFVAGEVALDVLVSDVDFSLGRARRCPLLPAVSDLVEGKIQPGVRVAEHNCLNCPHAILAESRSQPSLPPAPEEKLR